MHAYILTQLNYETIFSPILHSLLTYMLEEMNFQVTVYFLDTV